MNSQVETMFEKYNFAGVYIQIQAVLTLYAQGAYKCYWRLRLQIVLFISSIIHGIACKGIEKLL